MQNKNHAAIKDRRKALKHHLSNVRTKSQLKFLLNRSKTLLDQGNKAEAEKSIRDYQQAVDKAAKKGVVKPNKAGRKKSQLMRSLKAAK